MTDYVTGGQSIDTVLAMFYCFPLAPIYRERAQLTIRPDGRIHGVFPDARTVFVIEPDDVTVWQAAYDANLALFPLNT